MDLVNCAANAELINSDYDVFFDNGTVLDRDTNLEWLDLQLTDGMSRLEASIEYSEFSFATRQQYYELMGNAFPGFSNFSLSANDLDAKSPDDNTMVNNWVRLFGITVSGAYIS